MPSSFRNVWLCGFLGAIGLLTACDGGDSEGDAGGDAATDGGDVCAGRETCDAAGSTCDGSEVVTCAADADGCLVETREACEGSETCAVSGGVAACVDPCEGVPAAERCDAASRACDGDTLEVCAMNAEGCFVLEITDCSASPDGVCDESGAMPMCVLPADPCAAIPASERCDVAGTSCDGESLVTCAADSFGCLVETTTDCTERADGFCDETASEPACAVPGDPCAGIVQCAAPDATCAGPSLVTCAPDAFGCLVETTTDCAAMPFGFCEVDAAGADRCSTAASDPCMGVVQCGSSESRACADRSNLSVCSANAFGCYVETATDCSSSGEVCDATSGTAMCADPCTLIPTCPGESYCDGATGELITCTADADGCYVESARAACGAREACTASGTTASCMDTICPQAGSVVLDCDSGTVSGDTSMGSAALTAYGCTSLTSYAGNEQIWRFRNNRGNPVEVRVATSGASSSRDYDLFAIDAGDESTACTSTSLTCLDSSRAGGAAETVDFAVQPGAAAYVSFDLYSTPTTDTTTYSLTVSCVDIVCGNGTRETGEMCDDGNVVDGDGCSAACTVEMGYICSGTPSVCTAPAMNSTCGGATAITGDTTLTTERLALGGPRPMGTGCGSSSGNNALYYAVTIPAFTRVDVQTTPTADIVLLTQDACGAAACTFRTDSSPERATLTNGTGSAVTRVVAIHNYGSSGASSTFDISFTYTVAACGNGVVDAGETCDDGNTADADGCSATCSTESGYICSGAPSMCVASAPNATCAGATVITSDRTITMERVAIGGPRPMGTGCGTSSGNSALYYAVTIPPGATMVAQTAPSFDIVLLVQNACGDGACTLRTDLSPERATLTNSTAAPASHIVAVHNYSSSGNGTYDISFGFGTCGDGVLDSIEQCDDGNTTASDGCSATCTVESTYSCAGSPSVCTTATYSIAPTSAMCVDVSAGAPVAGVTTDNSVSTLIALPFAFSYFGRAMTHYSVSSNGFVQLWASATGSPSTASSNTAMPSTSTPNGVVAPFWDDLRPNAGANVTAVVTGSAGSQRLVLQWTDWRASSSGTESLTFQLHLTEGTNVVETHYCAMNAGTSGMVHTGSSATIGLENSWGTAAAQRSHNTASAVMTGSAFVFTPL